MPNRVLDERVRQWAQRALACAVSCYAVLCWPVTLAQAAGDTELTIVPLAGGDSDIGFGGGYLLSWASLSEDLDPYLVRVESGTVVTFKGAPPDLELPYLDAYLLLSIPHLVPRRLRLDARISHTDERQLKYYGLGNASEIPAGMEPTDLYFRYRRAHPTIKFDLTYNVTRRLAVLMRVTYSHNFLDVPPDTLLGEQQASPEPLFERTLGDARRHGVASFLYGLAWDSRDDEITPRSGQHHTLSAELSPGGIAEVPYRYARLGAEFRLYQTLVPKTLVLALRLVNDALLGEPPFYELARFDDTYALGGGKGVRGVPAQRYYGKVKVFGNFELRADIFRFSALGKRNVVGLTGFVDGGRLWTEYRAHPELDGAELGLHYGAGGGLRIAAGESFVLRADVAWSPEANPVGAYVTAGRLF